MGWQVIAVAAVITLILLSQGISFLLRRESPTQVRLFGLLTVIVSGVGFIGYYFLASGTLILSREFGVAMVEGVRACVGLALLLLGISAAAGLAWHAARLKAGLVSRRWWIAGASLAIGLLTTWRITSLNPHAPPQLRVYAVDLWWPPLVAWISASLVGCCLAIGGRGDPRGRYYVQSIIPAGLGIWVIQRFDWGFEPADPTTLTLWKIFLMVSLPLLTVSGTWLLASSPSIAARLPNRWKPAIILSVGAGAIGVLISAGVWSERASPVLTLSRVLLFGSCLLVPATLGALKQVQAWRHGTVRIPYLVGPGRLNELVILLCLGVAAFSVTDMLYLARVDQVVDLSALLLSWVLIVELNARGPLYALTHPSEGQEAGHTPTSPLARDLRLARDWLSRAAGWLGTQLRAAVQVNSVPVALVKTLLAVLLLVALSEVPNAGKIIVRPFDVHATKPDPDLGRLIANRLLNTLGMYKKELSADLLTLTPGAKGSAQTRLVASTEGTVPLETALAKSSDVKLWGGLEIPLGIVVSPIQSLMRYPLGVREIYGTFHAEQDGYAILASSSVGDSWKVRLLSATLAVAPSQSARGEDPATTLEFAATNLADQLAFQILAQDAGMASVGMTSSWPAFEQFQEGLAAWRKFGDGVGDYDALTESIEHFGEAARADPRFALALYRLGLALRKDGQPAAAVDALRRSLNARPNFVAGYIALAFTLHDFDGWRYPQPAALSPLPVISDEARAAYGAQSRELMQHVLLFPRTISSLNDRASAFYGLCLAALDSEEFPLAYFYCKRAEQVYQKLPPDLREDPQSKDTEAAVLNTIGVALSQRRMSVEPDTAATWSCAANQVDSVKMGPDGLIVTYNRAPTPYARVALGFYRMALALAPDDAVIRCNLAVDALLLGDDYPMKELDSSDAAAHEAVGDEILNRAITLGNDSSSARFFQLALAEYDKAIELAPADVNALNDYAYAYWQWRCLWPLAKSTLGPDSAVAQSADRRARYAARLVTGRVPIPFELAVRSTLGEVLLAEARPHEAIGVLKGLVEGKLPLVPRHARFDEIRWDLAQAYLCASSNDSKRGYTLSDVTDLRSRGGRLLSLIQENERAREVRPYTDQPQMLDAGRVLVVCRWRAGDEVER